MPVPTSITDLDPTAANNSPAGSDAIGTSLDDYLRSHAAIIRQVSNAALPLAGGTVTGQIKGITPIAADDLTRKDYVDGQFANGLTQAAADLLYVSLSGDTMTGGLKVGGTGLTFPDNSVQATSVTSAGISDRGSFQLPGGVRIQYGTAVLTFSASGDANLPYNSAFPNTAWLVSCISGDDSAASSVTFSVISSNLSGANLRCITVNPYAYKTGAVRVNWLAAGT